MAVKMFLRTLAATAAFVAISSSQSAFAASVPCEIGTVVTNVMSCSTAVSVNLNLLNGLAVVQIGPLADAFGTAPAPYSVTNNLASINVGAAGNFGTAGVLGKLGLTTGIVMDSASSTYTGAVSTLSSTATSTVNNLDLGLKLLGLSIVDVTAGTLSSTSSASDPSGLNKIIKGSSYITGLTVSALGATTFTGNITAATPANDTILSALGLDVVANYQAPILLNGTDKIGIQTAALAIELDNYGFTSGLTHYVLNGTILIADSAASVPEPATWAMMLFGFGLVGAMARQRRTLAFA